MSAITLFPVVAVNQLHLTRRGRAVRSICLSALLLFAVLVAGRLATDLLARSFRVVPQEPVVSGVSVVVAEGDSLWRIARRELPDLDPRAAVAEIQAVNQLRGNLIHPGQVLTLPVP